jgi:hypothetical protein
MQKELYTLTTRYITIIQSWFNIENKPMYLHIDRLAKKNMRLYPPMQKHVCQNSIHIHNLKTQKTRNTGERPQLDKEHLKVPTTGITTDGEY